MTAYSGLGLLLISIKIVANQPPTHLRLVPADRTGPFSREPEPSSELFLAAFQEATGWELRLAEEAGTTRGRLAKPGLATGQPSMPLSLAQKLAEAAGPLLGELAAARRALVAREAELAAGVPVKLKPDEPHLAERLEAILKGGAQAVGCSAAAMYLLDEATTALKLRAAYGLPATRLLDPPRPLRGAIADLEALAGHAVVLEDTQRLPHWKSPESFPAAACIPISSPSMPLGTFWVFADAPRDFTDEQTNLLEIIAGRLAAELERETLISAGYSAHQQERQQDRVTQWQQARLPSIAPLVDGWEIGGFSVPAGAVAREFFDWQVLTSGELCLALGGGSGLGISMALNGAVLHSAYRAHSQYPQRAEQLLSRLNETMWTAADGDQLGALGVCCFSPDSGRGNFSSAGGPTALLVTKESQQFLSGSPVWLGERDDIHFRPSQFSMTGGDLLLLTSAELVDVNETGAFDPDSLADFLRRYRRHSLDGVLSALRSLVMRAAEGTERDVTVVAVRRLG